MNSRKITYSAVCSAIAVVALVVASFTPANVVPLVFVSAAIYVALCKTGWFGLLSIAVTLILGFVFTGFRDSFVLTAVLFLPYAILAWSLKKIKYDSLKNGLIRGVIMVVFFCLEGFLSILLLEFLTGVEIALIVNRFGQWMIYLVFGLISLPTDFFFVFATDKAMSILDKTGGNTRKS